ncbi:MAG: hypothetical protein AAFY41_04585, partial [Bacteroidota bacterium]
VTIESVEKIGLFKISPELVPGKTHSISISIKDVNQNPIYKPLISTTKYQSKPRKKLLISGKVHLDNTPMSNTLISINALKDSIDFRYTITDQYGNFQFIVPPFHGVRQLVLSQHSNKIGKVRFSELEMNIKPIKEINLPKIDTTILKEAIRLMLLSKKVDETYDETTKKPVWTPQENTPLTNYNSLIKLSDYVSLSTMKQVIKEIVPHVMFRNDQIKVYSPEAKRTFAKSPLIFIDGEIATIEKMMNLDVSNLKFIELINMHEEMKPFGRLGSGGVISIINKEDFTGKKEAKESDSFLFEFRGLNQVQKKTQKERVLNKPYFPTSLYWNSNLMESNEDLQIRFRLPDVKTYFIADIVFHLEDGSHTKKQQILIY